MRRLFKARLTDEEREAQVQRILFVETNIMLPVKVVAIALCYYYYRSMLQNAGESATAAAVARAYFTQLNFYTVGNAIFTALLLIAAFGKIWPRTLRVSAFFVAMFDALFLSGVIYFTGGLDSVLYWLYVGLMIRGAVNFPIFWQQTVLNVSTALFYTLAVVLVEETFSFFAGELYWMRITILGLVGACCWGVYALIERGKRRASELQELLVRSERMAATGRLAAEVAHQLKNPLGIINNAAFLLQREAEQRKPATPQTVELIREEVARSDKILCDLMNYARLSEGRIEALNVNDAIDRALAQVRPDGRGAGLRVVKQFSFRLPSLAAQRAQVEECFTNLIKNAVEAMPSGGTLTLATRYAGNGRIEVDVEDTGCGIDAEALPKIFDPFFTTKSGGTGLGLAIVKHVVETYGGTVSVATQSGKGTRFRVSLPLRTSNSRRP